MTRYVRCATTTCRTTYFVCFAASMCMAYCDVGIWLFGVPTICSSHDMLSSMNCRGHTVSSASNLNIFGRLSQYFSHRNLSIGNEITRYSVTFSILFLHFRLFFYFSLSVRLSSIYFWTRSRCDWPLLLLLLSFRFHVSSRVQFLFSILTNERTNEKKIKKNDPKNVDRPECVVSRWRRKWHLSFEEI